MNPLEDTATLSRFAAMPKLVDEREFDELEGTPGFDARLLRRLRLERRRAYRLYLAEFQAQFSKIVAEALDRAANDPGVDPGFLGKVLKLKTRFTISIWLLKAGIWLPAVNLKTYQRTCDLVKAINNILPSPVG